MIQKTIRSAILGIIAVLSISATPSLAFNGYVDVTNNTGYDIYYLYISNENSKSWEEDVLGTDILYNGQTVRVKIRNADSEYFDIRAEDEDGDTYTRWQVDIEISDVTFTLGDLD